MYTLILTLSLIASHSYPSSVTIEHIDGFKSQEACLRAGNAWIDSQKRLHRYVFVEPNIAALCVKDE